MPQNHLLIALVTHHSFQNRFSSHNHTHCNKKLFHGLSWFENRTRWLVSSNPLCLLQQLQIHSRWQNPSSAPYTYRGRSSTKQLDDLYLQDQNYEQCNEGKYYWHHGSFDKLGLGVHPEKSTFLPTQVLVINSVQMTVELISWPEKNPLI